MPESDKQIIYESVFAYILIFIRFLAIQLCLKSNIKKHNLTNSQGRPF